MLAVKPGWSGLSFLLSFRNQWSYSDEPRSLLVKLFPVIFIFPWCRQMRRFNVYLKLSRQDGYCLSIRSCNRPGCMKQYSGLSTRPRYIRFSEHLASIRDPATTSPVGLHWQEPGHTLAHLTFLPVEKVGNRCPATLRQREKDLINRTGVLAAGLNTYR